MLGFSRRHRGSSRFCLALAAALVSTTLCTLASAQVPDATPKENDSRDTTILPPVETDTPDVRAGEAFTFTGGFDISSHFISFGADVWGGGGDEYPFTGEATQFAYGTVTAKITDEISVFGNIWSDLNNNVDSSIGGWVQEIDFNTGITYSWNSFTFGVAHNYWIYGGDEEYAVEASVGYNDSELWKDTFDGFALNPAVLFHYRYEGWGEQEEAGVLQVSVRPSFTFMKEEKYPITLAIPAAVAFFTDDYQGGDGGGYGYSNVGVAVSVPLAFIPIEYGNWTAGVSAAYWNTPDDAIPGNPEENFVVTAVSFNVAF